MVSTDKEDPQVRQEEMKWFLGLYYLAWLTNMKPRPNAFAGFSDAQIEVFQSRVGYSLPFLMYHRQFSPATAAGRTAIFTYTGLADPAWAAVMAEFDIFPLPAAESAALGVNYLPGQGPFDLTIMSNADLQTDADLLAPKPKLAKLTLCPIGLLIEAFAKDYGNQVLQLLPVLPDLYDFS
ncbi:MAG: hypothetical protein WC895_02600 [Candidatus Shapirobacteria bacterium]|jgi:hypothetical protein